MFGQFKIKVDGQPKNVVFKKYNLVNLSEEDKRILGARVHSILIDCWGKFHDEFIDRHVLRGDRLMVAKVDGDDIGFCVLSFKKICGRDVHYVEFLTVRRLFQKLKVGPRLFYLTISEDIKRNFFSLIYKPIEIMFITPNIRALAHVARFASFIYPNPHLADEDGKIHPADELTWNMAQELIEHSDKPHRKLHREGLVLHDSYADTPWLVYGFHNAPWIENPKMLKFVERYMGYYQGEDKEFVVRAHITLGSLGKYFYHQVFK